MQNKKDYCDVQHFHWLENKKSFFISKQEQVRLDKKAGIARYKKAESKRRILREKLEQRQGFTKKPKPRYENNYSK